MGWGGEARSRQVGEEVGRVEGEGGGGVRAKRKAERVRGERWVSNLAIHSGKALFQLMPQIIHLILLQVQVSTAVSQNAFVAAGPGLDLLQLTAPALQPHPIVGVQMHDNSKCFLSYQSL